MAEQPRPAWAAAIRQQRLLRCLTWEALAEATDVQPRTVARWESGRQRPGIRQVGRICQVFDMSPADLRLVASEAHDTEDPDVNTRRDFNKGVGALIGLGVLGVAAEPWERLTHALRPASAIDMATVGHLEAVTVSLSQLERTAGAPATLLPGVTGHLDALTGFLNGSQLDATVRHHLCSLAAETAALAGWLTWDLADQARADHYFRSGLEAAREAGDAAMGAYLLGSIHHRPMVREDPRARLQRLQGRAYGFRGADASSHTRGWLAILEAEAHAMLGDGDRYDRLSAQAEELLLRDDPDDVRRPRVIFFDAPYLAESRAAALLRLGRPRQARETLVDVLPITAGRMRLWMLTDLAEACAAEGEPEQAAAYAMQALDGAAAGRLGPILESLRGLPDGELAPFGDVPAVREFRERMVN